MPKLELHAHLIGPLSPVPSRPAAALAAAAA